MRRQEAERLETDDSRSYREKVLSRSPYSFLVSVTSAWVLWIQGYLHPGLVAVTSSDPPYPVPLRPPGPPSVDGTWRGSETRNLQEVSTSRARHENSEGTYEGAKKRPTAGRNRQ